MDSDFERSEFKPPLYIAFFMEADGAQAVEGCVWGGGGGRMEGKFGLTWLVQCRIQLAHRTWNHCLQTD